MAAGAGATGRPRRRSGAARGAGAAAVLALCAAAGATAAGAGRAATGGGPVTGAVPSGALRDGDSGYQIVIASGWRPIDPPSGTLVAYQAPDGRARLALTQVEVGSRTARTFPLVVDEVERGVERVTASYRRVRRRTGQVGRVRTLDLWYRRAPTPTANPTPTPTAHHHHHHHHDRSRDLVLSRYLFYRTHTVVLSVGLDPGAPSGDRRAARAMLRSFTIFPP
jgi:hypothetical protein